MFCENLEKLYERYDTFLIDMYGVLWNGRGFFSGVLSLLKKMRTAGKQVIILSNTTLTATKCHERYFPRGMLASTHFDTFISSGEVLKNTIKTHFKDAKTYFPAFCCPDDIFANSGLIHCQFVEKSDFVFVGNLNYHKPYFADGLKDKRGKSIPIAELTFIDYHNIADFEEVSSFIDLCLKHNKTLAIANSDLFAIESFNSGNTDLFKPIICQGYIGALYENAGGKVIYFGKPYPVIFDYAKQFISAQDKVAMVGDTPWTDILGGNIAGFETILTLSGIAQLFLKNNSENEVNKFINDIGSKMVHTNLKSFSQIPTHIVNKFA